MLTNDWSLSSFIINRSHITTKHLNLAPVFSIGQFMKAFTVSIDL